MRGLIRSFGYAFRGIFYTLKHERNMRIHFVCMIYMYSFLLMADFFEITRTQFAIIFLANALVVSLELVNTAVERTVDLASTEWTDNGNNWLVMNSFEFMNFIQTPEPFWYRQYLPFSREL